MSYSNDVGISTIRKKTSEAVRIVITLSPLFIIFLTAFYVVFQDKLVIYFFAVLPFFGIQIAFVAAITLLSLKRCSKTIREIEFESDKITISTFSGSVYDSKILELDNDAKIKLIPSHFPWYGKGTNRKGCRLFVGNEEFFLVEDFFDDYVNILDRLKRNEQLK